MLTRIESALSQLRKTRPLVLCLTNFVTMDFMANSLLALGASPLMSCDEREFEDLIKIVHAVNLNIGTLDANFIKRYKLAIELTKHYQKPLVLDPVGAGASILRTLQARKLMSYADIIRGNASEVIALLSDEYTTLGVESNHSIHSAQYAAYTLASNLGSTIIVSGPEDFITNGTKKEFLNFGSSLMPLITGMGCTLTSVVAAFRAVIPNSFEASVMATAYFGLCGNLAAHTTDKPGSFRTAFIDALYTADFNEMRRLSHEA